jgi:hypothetical protein
VKTKRTATTKKGKKGSGRSRSVQPPVLPEARTPLEAMLDMAIAVERRASEESSHVHLDVLRIVDALELFETRARRKTADPTAASALAAAADALQPYAKTRASDERWIAVSLLAPRRRSERPDAVRELLKCAEAASKALALASARQGVTRRRRTIESGRITSERTDRLGRDALVQRVANFQADFLLGCVERLKLAPANQCKDVAPLAVSLRLGGKAHVIASLALRAAGIPRATANNWVNAVV